MQAMMSLATPASSQPTEFRDHSRLHDATAAGLSTSRHVKPVKGCALACSVVDTLLAAAPPRHPDLFRLRCQLISQCMPGPSMSVPHPIECPEPRRDDGRPLRSLAAEPADMLDARG